MEKNKRRTKMKLDLKPRDFFYGIILLFNLTVSYMYASAGAGFWNIWEGTFNDIEGSVFFHISILIEICIMLTVFLSLQIQKVKKFRDKGYHKWMKMGMLPFWIVISLSVVSGNKITTLLDEIQGSSVSTQITLQDRKVSAIDLELSQINRKISTDSTLFAYQIANDYGKRARETNERLDVQYKRQSELTQKKLEILSEEVKEASNTTIFELVFQLATLLFVHIINITCFHFMIHYFEFRDFTPKKRKPRGKKDDDGNDIKYTRAPQE